MARLTRATDLNYAIRNRACQAGSRSGKLLETGLTRINSAGQQPKPTLLLIQYILDPLAVIKSRPDANLSRLALTADEAVFWYSAQWNITTALQKLLVKEWELQMPLTTTARAASIRISFRLTPPPAKLAQARMMRELNEALVNDQQIQADARRMGKPVRKLHVNPSTLVEIGFFSKMSKEKPLNINQRITKTLIRFTIDPAAQLRENTYAHPFHRRDLTVGEIRLFLQMQRKIIDVLGEVVAEAEQLTGNTYSLEQRIDIIHQVLRRMG